MCYVVQPAFIMQTFVTAKDYYYWPDVVLFKLCKELITYLEMLILCM